MPHFCGPGDYDLEAMLPPGTDTFQMREAPSGHLLLPCTHYKEIDSQQMKGSLTLDKNQSRSLLANSSDVGTNYTGTRKPVNPKSRAISAGHIALGQSDASGWEPVEMPHSGASGSTE